MITVVESDRLYAVFSIPESNLQLVESGDSCRVFFKDVNIDAQPQQSAIAKIKPVADPLSRSFKAYVPVGNPNRKLRPGMLTQVNLPGKSHEMGIAVPPEVLVRRNNTMHLWTITNGRAMLKRVLTGKLGSRRIRITKGIQPGDTLITGGGINLREGMAVEVAR